jgi:DNA-binding transcriptional MerR regulator
MLKSLQIMAGSPDNKWYSFDDFLELSGLRKKQLEKYIKKGLIFRQERGFSSQELKLISILKRAKKLGLSENLFYEYVKSAKAIAKIEYSLGAKMLESDERRYNEQYELLFDSILTLKPYLFNMHTMQEHQKQMEQKQ